MFTCGEAGSIGVSKELQGEKLCRRRRREFAASCEALGVADYRIVGAPDKGVETIPRGEGVGHVLRQVERVQPQVVLTFHHGGVSGHPDHIAVAGFLDDAFDRALREHEEPPLVYYQWGIPRELAGLYDRPNLVPMEDDEVAVVIDVPPEAMERKMASIHCHETQLDFYHSLESAFDYREVASREFFSRRRSRLGAPPAVVGDLFAGVPGWEASG
jgi:LmbE family N-acetylglucosaminyl deacetylase